MTLLRTDRRSTRRPTADASPLAAATTHTTTTAQDSPSAQRTAKHGDTSAPPCTLTALDAYV
eukprot:7380821-Prymnesium_polylepis.1